MQAMTDFSWPVPFDLPGYHPVTRPHARQVREAARLISESRRPVLYVGGGVIRASAAAQLRELADLTGIPVVTTLMARGAFPDQHPQHMGMPGMHGTVAAVGALQKADLIIALGTRFDDRVTGKLDTFAPGALIVHADIDPAEISKNRRADVPIVGDCREVIADLTAAVRAEHEQGHRPDLAELGGPAELLAQHVPAGLRRARGRHAGPAVRDRADRRRSPARRRCTWPASASTRCGPPSSSTTSSPGTWINSGGLGTMGFAVPAAMGAKVGRPDACVWAIDGDGCFQMTNQELATCAIEGIPVKIAIINNGSLGMVRQWQTLFYNERYSNTSLDRTAEPRKPSGTRIPDFVKLAEAYGCEGIRCEEPGQVDKVIEQAMAIDDRPVVVDFVVHKDAMVWPMVAAGTSNNDIKFARGMAPDWEARTNDRAGQRSERHSMTMHTLSVLVENKPGVLVRIAGLFSRRNFNIDSLAVGPTEHEEISRITIVVNCEEHPLEQVTKQLNKLINVLKIVELEPGATVQRELILIKVRADADSRSKVLETVSLFRARVVDVALDVVTVEATGNREKLDALIKVLEPFGIKELVQSGMVAIGRGGRSITDRALRPVGAQRVDSFPHPVSTHD